MKNTQSLLIITLLVFACSLPDFTHAQSKSEPNKYREIIPERNEPSLIQSGKRIATTTGIPLVLYRPDYAVTPGAPENMARQFLIENAVSLKHKGDLTDLQFIRSFKSKSGYRVLYTQQAEGFPVYGSSIKISINNKNRVVFAANGYRLLGKIDTKENLTENDAIQKSVNYLGITGTISHQTIKKVIFNVDAKSSMLAYQVNLIPTENNFGDWELIISASSGEILRVEDRACYYHPDTDSVVGSGWVFDPDPITRGTAVYGLNGFKDNNDADSDSLTAQLVELVLENITYEDDNELFYLKGPYAEVVDTESPFNGLFKQEDSAFHFTRSDDAFEAVNCYHHIHQSMKYLNEDLGFDVMPYQYSTGVRFDPHGLNGADNSYYQSGNGRVTFGEGGVDDAEDVGVIIHELGHGIHDWITVGGISQVNGLSEGLGDYWVTSYIRSLGFWEPEDNQNNWVFIWDGHNEFWNGRITNDPGHYPEDLGGGIHKEGQLWSSSLMQIWDLVGKEVTDTDCWEGISMTDGNSSHVDAAMAVMQADIDLYDGEHLSDIGGVFADRGYIDALVDVDFLADTTNGRGPLTVNFTDESFALSGDITGWNWDFDSDGIVDSDEENPTHVYTDPGAYTVTLTVFVEEDSYTIEKLNYITVNAGTFVFEPEDGLIDHSGAFIRDYLSVKGYDKIYSNFFPSTFDGFDAVFISLGNYESGITTLTDKMAETIVEFLQAGGKVYLESGDAFGDDQNDNTELLTLFGLESAIDGQKNIINELSGQEGALTQDIVFNATTQWGKDYIDLYTVLDAPGAQVAFVESDYGNVAIQNAGTEYGQRTFCFSYALAALADGEADNTKEHLLQRIIDFFNLVTGFNEIDFNDIHQIAVFPNPAKNLVSLEFVVEQTNLIQIELFDFSGRKIANKAETYYNGRHKVDYSISTYPPGVYYFRIQTGFHVETIKWVKVN